jgi:L-seryl-tRNA(Ser) seleniumtransferase
MRSESSDILREMRELPPVDLLLTRLAPAPDEAVPPPRELLLSWIRQALEEARAEIRAAAAETDLPARGRSAWVELLARRVQSQRRDRVRGLLRRAVNASGIVLHTNIGRAPLSAAAQEAVSAASSGYSSLEIDLASGRRRSRLEGVARLLPLITGAEAGLAVHNNAAAVFLVLTGLAAGREVVVSRGHLVEIGGSFRLPEIMAASGARLVEVGSTNRTRLEDYARAIGPQTALILKVHPSNFRLLGFTEEVPTPALAGLARERGLPLFHDVGSGALRQHGDLAFDEPRVQDALADGADLVSFSADKLLGGPQAGLLVGGTVWIDRLRRHPAARVVRLDKTALAALEATLEAYAQVDQLPRLIPLLGLLARTEVDLEARAEALAALLRAVLPETWRLEVIPTLSEVGGGSLPGLSLPSRGVTLEHPERRPDEIARALRLADPAVIGRIEKDRYLLDVRAVLDGEEILIRDAAGCLLQPVGA